MKGFFGSLPPFFTQRTQASQIKPIIDALIYEIICDKKEEPDQRQVSLMAALVCTNIIEAGIFSELYDPMNIMMAEWVWRHTDNPHIRAWLFQTYDFTDERVISFEEGAIQRSL